MSVLLGLEYDNEYDPRVRDELQQLVASLQRGFSGLASHSCAVFANTSQSIVTATWTTLTFTSIDEDTDGIFTTSGSTFVIPVTGMWLMTGYGSWASSAAGNVRALRILKNGTTAQQAVASPPIAGGFNVSMAYVQRALYLQGDRLQFQGFQDTGGNLVIGATTRDLATAFTLKQV